MLWLLGVVVAMVTIFLVVLAISGARRMHVWSHVDHLLGSYFRARAEGMNHHQALDRLTYFAYGSLGNGSVEHSLAYSRMSLDAPPTNERDDLAICLLAALAVYCRDRRLRIPVGQLAVGQVVSMIDDRERTTGVRLGPLGSPFDVGERLVLCHTMILG